MLTPETFPRNTSSTRVGDPAYGRCHHALLLDAITNHDHLIQGLRVLFQDNLQISLRTDLNRMGEIADKRDFQDIAIFHI